MGSVVRRFVPILARWVLLLNVTKRYTSITLSFSLEHISLLDAIRGNFILRGMQVSYYEEQLDASCLSSSLNILGSFNFLATL